MSTITFLLGDAHKIRVTKQDPYLASALDVVSAVTGKSTKSASKILKNMAESFPEVSQFLRYFQFPGKAQTNTPVADARGIWKIITLLPGKAATIFREKAGDVMVRFLGGDETLIAEIRGNRAAQEALAIQDPENPLRFIGKTVEAEMQAKAHGSIISQREQLDLEKLKLDLEERRIRVKRMEMELANELMRSFTNDERDILFMKDAKRTCLSEIFGGCTGMLITQGEGVAQAFRRELTVADVAKSLHMPFKSNKDLIKYGRACAQLYRTEHNGALPTKCDRFVDGATRSVNCYYEEDRDLLIRAIQSTV